jgi:hypothetical protein
MGNWADVFYIEKSKAHLGHFGIFPALFCQTGVFVSYPERHLKYLCKRRTKPSIASIGQDLEFGLSRLFSSVYPPINPLRREQEKRDYFFVFAENIVQYLRRVNPSMDFFLALFCGLTSKTPKRQGLKTGERRI